MVSKWRKKLNLSILSCVCRPEDQGLVDAQEQFRQASTNVNKLEMEIRVKEKQQQSAR